MEREVPKFNNFDKLMQAHEQVRGRLFIIIKPTSRMLLLNRSVYAQFLVAIRTTPLPPRAP